MKGEMSALLASPSPGDWRGRASRAGVFATRSFHRSVRESRGPEIEVTD